jgi:hypothetical protein
MRFALQMPVDVFGQITGDATVLKGVEDGQEIVVDGGA